jgi:hypothetical protein
MTVDVRKGEPGRQVPRFQRSVLGSRRDQCSHGAMERFDGRRGARLISNSILSASSLPFSGRPDLAIDAGVIAESSNISFIGTTV